ncbi:MAG: periplasmic heavy metal sensor [Pseudomonadota bacterium]
MTGLLVASLSVNLLVAGAFGGMAIRDMAEADEALSRRDRMLMQLLPTDYHDKWVNEVWESQTERLDLRRQIHGVQAQILEAIRAEPFDPEALRAAFEARRALRGQMVRITHERFVVIGTKLSPSARQEMAVRVEAMLDRFTRRSERRAAALERQLKR